MALSIVAEANGFYEFRVWQRLEMRTSMAIEAIIFAVARKADRAR